MNFFEMERVAIVLRSWRAYARFVQMLNKKLFIIFLWMEGGATSDFSFNWKKCLLEDRWCSRLDVLFDSWI